MYDVAIFNREHFNNIYELPVVYNNVVSILGTYVADDKFTMFITILS